VLAGRRRVLEDEVAGGAEAAAVGVETQVHLPVVAVCKKTGAD
jgi:hypothetical protein